jgi:Ca2+/Na+ antiporter
MAIGEAIGTVSLPILLGLLAWFWLTPEDTSKKPSIFSRLAIAATVFLICLLGAIPLSFGVTLLTVSAGKGVGLTEDLIWLAYWLLSFLWIGYSFAKPRRKTSKVEG